MKDGWENETFYVSGAVAGGVSKDSTKIQIYQKKWHAIARPGYISLGHYWTRVGAQKAIEDYHHNMVS